ncbi:hypothetical protein BVX98_05465 [bacterium F11]|nr:hypothetical protein BVX98_05465 [bacterium F11]
MKLKTNIRWLTILLGMAVVSSLYAEEKTKTADIVTVDAVIAKDVQDRQPVGEASSFSSDTETVVGWTLVKGAEEPIEITHVWSYKGEEMSAIPLNIRSSAFRTWSRKTLFGLTGTWTFEVKDPEGKVLATQTFEVTESPAPTKSKATTK